MANQLFINNEKLGSETFVGTREEWRNSMIERPLREWYAEYTADLDDQLRHQEIDEEDATPISFDEWVENTLDDGLTAVSEEEASEYESL